MYSSIERFLTFALALSVAGTGYGYFNLPGPAEVGPIHPLVLEPPRQSDIPVHPFKFPYEGRTYVIEPVAEYEIAGLVVSHNDTAGITDAYHDSASVDLKDLCVVWGKNASRRILKDLSFRSEPWTCFVQFENEQGEIAFRPTELSNNHLLGATAVVRDIIRSIHVGDQVLMRGKLVNYYDERYPESVRQTSTTRTDSGNGACEVLFVDSISVLSRAAPGLWKLFEVGKIAVLVLAVARLLAFLLVPYLEFRSAKIPKMKR